MIENGRFVALEPDPSHPTGKALCAKGRAAPELVYHPDRLLYPLKRTRPKGDPDPGWQRISWDEALDLTAARLRKIAEEHGPESVVFSVVSPSTSASDDSLVWIQRLMNAFGSPNLCVSMELCGWGRYQATQYTFGAGVPGAYMPDLGECRLHSVLGLQPKPCPADPCDRHRGGAQTRRSPDRGRPTPDRDRQKGGSSGCRCGPAPMRALALGIAQVMIERGWYDREFIRDWTNGPLLVRTDNGRLLTQRDLSGGGQRPTVRGLERGAGPPDPL